MSNMDAFTNVPDHQKAEFMRHLEDTQIKDSLKLYNNLVETCFDKCVAVGWGGGFRSKTLDASEGKCISECAEKYMKMTQRIGFRMAEYQSVKSQQPPQK